MRPRLPREDWEDEGWVLGDGEGGGPPGSARLGREWWELATMVENESQYEMRHEKYD